MNKYTVYKYFSVRECWEVEAEDEMEAKIKADIGNGNLVGSKETSKDYEVYED